MAGFWGASIWMRRLAGVQRIRACTHKRDDSGIGVINLEENVVQIGLILAEMLLLFMNCDIDLYFQGQLM